MAGLRAHREMPPLCMRGHRRALAFPGPPALTLQEVVVRVALSEHDITREQRSWFPYMALSVPFCKVDYFFMLTILVCWFIVSAFVHWATKGIDE